MGKSLTQNPRGGFGDLAQFGAAGPLPADGQPPQKLIKGDGTDTPISMTATKFFVNGQEVVSKAALLSAQNTWTDNQVFGGGFTVNAGSVFGPAATWTYIAGSEATHRTALLANMTAKATIVDADLIVGKNSAAGGSPISIAASVVWNYITSKFQGVSSKATLVDNDRSLILDSAASNAPKYSTSLAVWNYIKSKLDGTLTLNGTKTLSDQLTLNGQTAANGNAAITRDLSIATTRRYNGVMPGSDSVTDPAAYNQYYNFKGSFGAQTDLIGDASLGGLTLWGPTTSAEGRAPDSLDLFAMPANNRAIALGAVSSGSPGDVGPLTSFSGKTTASVTLYKVNQNADGMTGRRFYFGFGIMTAGAASNLTKGGLGVAMGGASDYIQIWTGSSWVDTVLRWKNGTSLLVGVWDFQIVREAAGLNLYGRVYSADGSGAWTSLGTRTDGLNASAYGAAYLQVVAANLVDNATFDAASVDAQLRVSRYSFAFQ